MRASAVTAHRDFHSSSNQLAHSLGYRVILTPARDLALVPGTTNQRQAGEDISAWYLRTNIAACAARFADVVDRMGLPELQRSIMTAIEARLGFTSDPNDTSDGDDTELETSTA